MDTKEALKSFELDARLFYDAIAFSTDDYLYIIDMQRDIALVSDNMRDDFDRSRPHPSLERTHRRTRSEALR
mgnify:CR=1 FL=1